jgi:HPr kinase/phosphorylase
MAQDLILHASCVAVDGRGLLILGAAGSGKSSLALTLMAWGARLVADDRSRLTLHEGGLWASAPETIRGQIEARGIGILTVPALARARLAAAVDLDRDETERLPPERNIALLGHELPLILNGPGLSFAAGVLHYLKGTRLS